MFRQSLHRLCLAFLTATLLASCGSTSSAPSSYHYKYIRGKTATISNGRAVAPANAPRAVKAAIAAGNRISGAPYQYGGGRGRPGDYGFDCSGAASYVLRAAGAMNGYGTSSTFRSYGEAGKGDWIDIWARNGHVFLTVAGLRFDTGWHAHNEGPRWTTKSRPAKGYVIRHPRGL